VANKKISDEEKKFYIALGSAMWIAELGYKIDYLQHNTQDGLTSFNKIRLDLTEYFVPEMLHNYMSGKSRISVFNLMKFLKFCKKDISTFMKEFEDQLKKENKK